RSIGLDLGHWVKKGLLKFYITRPALYGLEMHIVLIEDMLNKFQPSNAVLDPISDFIAIGGGNEVKSMLTRLQDMMKSRGMTVIYTDLLVGDISNPRRSEAYISSMIDTWILLRNIEYNGERSRGLTVIKSRGMPHSNQIREFVFSEKGIDLIQPYVGPAGVFMGSARVIQEAKDKQQIIGMEREIQNKKDILGEKRREYDAKIVALEARYNVEKKNFDKNIIEMEQDLDSLIKDRKIMSQERKSDVSRRGGM
ncbi:MAG TPA: ATPase domain-containing protein, partial [Methanocellaceae archaeon]